MDGLKIHQVGLRAYYPFFADTNSLKQRETNLGVSGDCKDDHRTPCLGFVSSSFGQWSLERSEK